MITLNGRSSCVQLVRIVYLGYSPSFHFFILALGEFGSLAYPWHLDFEDEDKDRCDSEFLTRKKSCVT